MMNATTNEQARVDALAIASAVVGGKIGIIEGCRRLSSLGHELVPDRRMDADFVIFMAVDSETDSLPVGSVRKYWDPVALAREDTEIARAEGMARESVVAACQNVIKRLEGEE